MIISGASGTGKTTALTQLGRTHELHTRKRYPADRHRLPVLYVTVPPAATARMLAVEFARFLGLEFSGRANITDIVNAVCATAANTRVELVCIDELHNLNLATRAGAEVSDQLKYFDSDYVFVNLWSAPLGRPWSYSAVYDLVVRLRTRTGIAFGPHLYRHTYATWLLRRGAGMESVKELLGHASITTTIDRYGHLTVEDARRTLEAAGWFTGREVRW